MRGAICVKTLVISGQGGQLDTAGHRRHHDGRSKQLFLSGFGKYQACITSALTKNLECRYLKSLNESKLLSDVEKQAVPTMYYPGLDYQRPADMPVHFLYMASSFK